MTESLATGTYEILRNRLREAADDLRGRFEQLNVARAAVFGTIETKLGATAHVSTDHNCVPRDLLAIGDQLLLGYNVQFGLKTEIRCEDVFSLYRLEDEIAHPVSLDEIFNAQFRRDYEELYRYYKHTIFSRFFTSGPHVYFVFQVGKTPQDVKAFKWSLEGKTLRYVDNRSDQEVRFPEQHAFRWTRATREQHRSGLHPHISIQDVVFVECVGGDLTIKVEDNTEDGSGIYSEPVDNADQTLDDAEIYYCVLGNLILLKMKPYLEKDFRYFVYSTKRQQVTRLDAIAKSCVLLPDDHGIIFPGGMFLQTGSHKLFDHGLQDLLYERTVAAPNGEDFLYLFTDLESGTYLHLRYNLIRQQVDTPLVCHGQAFFEDGKLTTFRGQEHPQKHHALQLWQTPFVGPNYRVEVATDSMLYKIGNRELVRGMAECQELLQLIDKDDSYDELYMDLVKRSTDVLDSYFWLDREETMRLNEPLVKIRDAAAAAVEEFDKVVRVRRETESATASVQSATAELIKAIGRAAFDSVDQFVEKLASLREQRGHAIGLRERRYVDEALVVDLEKQLAEAAERLGYRCVQFLLTPKSLEPYRQRIEAAEQSVPNVTTAADGRKQQEHLAKIGEDLELLIETISQLRIEDLTQRTAIVDRTGDLLAELNRVRSGLKAHVRDLLSGEMEADFASQSKLLDQAAAGAMETADTPEKVDEALTRIMLQLEELEGRFAEFDELLMRLTEKRESLYEAFEARRQNLVEVRSRRAESLGSAADRILQGINSRTSRIKDADALRSYFASDPMVDKVRQIADQLQDLGDTVRMEDLHSRLRALADDSMRQLRDRNELYVGDDGAIKLGRHQFSVNRQPVELTSVVRDGELQVHLTGTQFFQRMSDPALEQSRDLWQQLLPSESEEVYRAEFLAYNLFKEITTQIANASLDVSQTATQYLSLEPDEQIEFVRAAMQQRHDEGYSRGVHDRDAAKLLQVLLDTNHKLGLLRFSPEIRSRAWFVWRQLVPTARREKLERWLKGFATVSSVLPRTIASAAYVQQLSSVLSRFSRGLLDEAAVAVSAEFLFAQLQSDAERRTVSPPAVQTLSHLQKHLPSDERSRLHDSIAYNIDRPLAAWTLALDAVDGYLRNAAEHAEDEVDPLTNYRHEIAALLIQPDQPVRPGAAVPVAHDVAGLAGDHPRISGGSLRVHFHEFLERLGRYSCETLPRFAALRDTKHRLLIAADQQLKTSEFKPKVLTSFVRNKLLDEVYLPLTGDNLAKQIGASGEGKRSDRMGLLLLISPPGYGKTTLMEYIANRLGLVFVKVNGPALGHNVTSLDPAEATNASAREEVKRINMGLEMGDNVMLYLDDIQHCNPELLQKFIPLCDATRRIEGVWNGQPKTYDLRGRKVAVVMAGNPYTESGERFQIPDMLANRADVYNLGEIIGDSREAFESSYIENCLTSNQSLQPLARASSQDQRAVIYAAERGSTEGLELESNLSSDQLADMIAVLKKLSRVRDIVLRVNRTYIRSAAQADSYRTEPPFKLQGSYRNMNRIAERVVPLMNDQELQSLIMSNYEQDAQTLTRDGESNLLKFKELMNVLTPEEAERWNNIKYAYVESVRMQGIEGEDSTAQVLRTIAGLRDGLESIRRTLSQAIAANHSNDQVVALQEGLSHLTASLNAVGGHLTEAISTGTQHIQRASHELPEQKVLVQHSVPRVMTDLVRSQFQLLYDGLRPVLESTAGSKVQLDQLRASIEDCLRQYRAMQQEIDEAKG
ncbi:MAG: DNA repair ATPase [Pirellulaceae bacterium]